MIEGVDYSWARPDPVALYRAGKRFACRYVGPGSAGKRLTLNEATALTRARVSIVALCEESARSALGGHRRGAAHAAASLAEARACGMPPGHPIYFAVDWDASVADLSTVRAYFEGAATVLPHSQIGVYGGIRSVDWLMDRGLCAWGFQTYAWSGGRWDSRAQIQQYRNGATVAGGTVDLCRATTDYYGQWMVGGARPPGEDDDMATPGEIWAADVIPVGGDPANTTWQAANALGYAVELGKQAVAKLDAIEGSLGDRPEAAVTLSEADREVIVREVTTGVLAQVGMIPTALEVARLVADEIAKRMEL